jgi:hypothetical protein
VSYSVSSLVKQFAEVFPDIVFEPVVIPAMVTGMRNILMVIIVPSPIIMFIAIFLRLCAFNKNFIYCNRTTIGRKLSIGWIDTA